MVDVPLTWSDWFTKKRYMGCPGGPREMVSDTVHIAFIVILSLAILAVGILWLEDAVNDDITNAPSTL